MTKIQKFCIISIVDNHFTSKGDMMYKVEYCGIVVARFSRMLDVKNYVFHHLASNNFDTYEIYRHNKEYSRFAWDFENNDIVKVNF